MHNERASLARAGKVTLMYVFVQKIVVTGNATEHPAQDGVPSGANVGENTNVESKIMNREASTSG